jgi:hypothetical protein
VAVLPNLKETRFHQVADFYTLVLLLHRLRNEGMTVTAHESSRNRLAGDLLTDFGQGVDELNERLRLGRPPLSGQEIFRDYLLTVKEGTDSLTNRNKREKILRTVLAGVFDEIDPKRAFNATQRRILWNATRRKKCSRCRQPIRRWEDLHIDHMQPFIRGGRTELSNARITHKHCNLSKGPR